MLEDLWPKALANMPDYFVDIKDLNPDWYICDEPKSELVLYASDRILRNTIMDKKENEVCSEQ